MNDLLISLGAGIALVAAASLALRRFLGARRAAVVAGFAAVGGYGALAALDWPGGDVFALHVALYGLTALAFGVIGGVRRFHWGPALIVGFFAFLSCLYAGFIVLADGGLAPGLARALLPEPVDDAKIVSVFPGTVAHDFQKKESLYNAYLAQVERQRARGWEVHKGWVGAVRAGAPAVFQVVVRDRDGRPVAAAEVGGRFLRPSDSRLDAAFTMRETDAPGVYRAELVLPVPGVWDLVLEVRRGGDVHELRASTSIGG